MRHMPTCGLSLAFQRTFPRVYDHVQDLLRIKRQRTSPQLSWPSWCYFPVGLSYDLLRQRYGYSQDGVEPFLLSALVGFNAQRRILYPDAGAFHQAAESAECASLPVGSLYNMQHSCLYISYPSDAEPGALGSFLFPDYNGPGEESLIIVLHLESYHVEPVCFPLPSGRSPMEELHFDLERAVHAGKPAGVSDAFFSRALRLCRVNLRILAQEGIRRPEAVLQ